MTLNSSQYGDARMATFPDISPQSFEVFTGSGGLNTHSEEPIRQASDPACQASEPASQASQPASQASEPASRASEPAS